MPKKESWTGRVFEDFEAGDVYEHPIGRTVITADNIWFTAITMNPNPIHFDHVYAAQTDFGKPLVNSVFTLALVTGLSVSDMSQNAVNLGWDAVRIPRPVFEGDTVYARSVVTESRDSKSRPHQGIVGFNTEGYNQDGKTVLTFSRTMLVYKEGQVPKPGRIAGD